MLNNFGLRQRELLTMLMEQRQGLTVDELVQRLDVTRTAVNQHLQALEQRQYVAKAGLVKTKGRPGYRYVLSENGIALFPKQYAWFASLLVGMIKGQSGADGAKDAMIRLGEQVAASSSAEITATEFNAKLEQVVGLMQQLGYAATIESDSDDEQAMIRANNCVFHELAQEHNEVCQFDISLLSKLLDKPVRQKSCMALGDDYCRFCTDG